MHPAEFKISEDLTMAARILESGTPYAIALHLNIRSFDKAITAESRIDSLEKEVATLRNEILDFRREMTNLQTKGREGAGSPDESQNTIKKAI